MIIEVLCLVAGGFLGSGAIIYILQQKRWPVNIRQVKQEVEYTVKRETILQSSSTYNCRI